MVRTAERAGLRSWVAVAAVAIGTFLLVTAEQLPVGLLTSVGADLRVTDGVAGLMVTVPGIVAAVSAPLVPVLVGRLDRRVLLGALMALMTLANALSALAPTYPVLLGSRVLVGIAIGGFWAVAGGLATRLVPERDVPRATALIFGGVAAANVLGVPIGTLLGGFAGWRIAFGALGALAAVVLVALFALLPRLVADRPLRPSALLAQLRDPGVATGILVTLLVVTGHFAAYTFVSPVLQQRAGLPEALVGPLLLGFGAAGIIGNFAAGAAVARRLYRTVLGIVLALALVLAFHALFDPGVVGGIALLLLWGLAYGGVSVSLQSWMIAAAPRAVEAATALWVAVFNLAIGLGALVGGLVVDRTALVGVLWLAAALFLLAAVAVRAGARRHLCGRRDDRTVT
ncbi:putative MFS family arabinose efflux permease [Pseudonocardia hierapolitana]|uniref:Putative MFS family arabinose efflux permease n=1 Tax=Pseudonocardia hierapolitana TaxID=1128676 RepID=A0A561SWY4_9PSEU|nr:MFS transporter [Pseudonocardia hierapolitana]TWF79341.1 putative MFS family arabinose efflux permease [Pseudonocardia hierapolitana]